MKGHRKQAPGITIGIMIVTRQGLGLLALSVLALYLF